MVYENFRSETFRRLHTLLPFDPAATVFTGFDERHSITNLGWFWILGVISERKRTQMREEQQTAAHNAQ